MLRSRMGRAVAGIVMLAGGTLLSGCGAGGEQNARVDAGTMAASGTVPADSRDVKVVFHMTGLLLVVPPAQGGGVTVLLPDTRKVGRHVARLGFGFDSFTSDLRRLCHTSTTYTDAGICYVDLYDWELREFGAGGVTSSPTPQLPSTVLNVTTVAGGKHKAHAPWLTGGELRRQVVFRSGGPGTTCSLASWTYDQVNEQGQTIGTKTGRLANVLDWEITNPTLRALVFRHRRTADMITIPLPQAGEVHIVLAHVPPADAGDLPPNENPSKPSANLPKLAPHFDVYYDLLRLPGQPPQKIPPGHSRRKFPRDAKDPMPEACNVSISRPGKRTLEARAIGTYACMVASANPPT